jgi:GDP-D-mannose dehydratase
MPMAKRTALVTGASGLAGGYMLAHLLEQGGFCFGRSNLAWAAVDE